LAPRPGFTCKAFPRTAGPAFEFLVHPDRSRRKGDEASRQALDNL